MDYRAFYLIKEGYGDYTNNQANWTSLSRLIKGKSSRCNRFKTEEEAKYFILKKGLVTKEEMKTFMNSLKKEKEVEKTGIKDEILIFLDPNCVYCDGSVTNGKTKSRVTDAERNSLIKEILLKDKKFNDFLNFKKWKYDDGFNCNIEIEGMDNIAFGENALKGQIFGTPMTADGNIALGKNALQDNITGGLNIALGQDALYSNTTGGWNIAQGLHALYKNTSGEQNIALGRNALYQNTSGQQNIGIGDGALSDNLTGQFNTAVGGYAGSWIKGNGNVHIGSGGGAPSAELDNVVLIGRLTNTLDATTGEDNVILLGDTSSAAPKVGIGTYKPGAKLEVNNGTTAGAVKIVDGTQGAGRVLTSDANGLATWKNVTLFTGTERIGVYHWGVGTALGNTNWNKIASITVPPGASMVYVKIHLLAGGLTSGAARAYVGKKDIGWNNSNTNDTPIGGSALFVTYHGIDPELQTSFIYNNTTNSNETLYLNLQSNQPTVARSGFEYPTGGVYLGTKWIENQFSAIPMN